MTQIARSASWTTISTIFNIMVQIIQLAILSRSLDTAIFGQFAILNLFVEIFTAIALGGIANYLMYKRDLNQIAKNTIFTLSIVVGVIAFILVNLLAFPILSLMNYPDLVSPLMLISVLLIMHAVGAQYQSVGLLAFRHPDIAKIEIVSRVISFIIAMLTIESGLYCLIFSALSYQLFRLIGIMSCLSKIANVRLSFDKPTVKAALHYGIYDLGGQWLNITRRQIDTIILSALLSLQELGIYHLIKQLASRPAQAIQPIINKMALPILSHAKQHNERMQGAYYDLFCVQAAILALFYAPLIGASELITVVVYGEKLQEYSIILALLSLFWYIRVAPSNLIGPLAQVTGKTYLNFYWNLIILPINALVMYFSALMGIYSLTMSLVVFQAFCIPLAFYFVIKKILLVDLTKKLAFVAVPLTLIFVPLFVLEQVLNIYFQLNLFVKLPLYIVIYSATTLGAFLLYPVFKQSLSRIKHYNLD